MGNAEEITGLQGLMQYLAENHASIGVDAEPGSPEAFFEWLAENDITLSGEVKQRYVEESLLEVGGELPPGIYCGGLDSIQENHDQNDPDLQFLRSGILFIGAGDSNLLALDLGTGEVHFGEQSAFDADLVFEGIEAEAAPEVDSDDDDDEPAGGREDAGDDVELDEELSEGEEEARSVIREGAEESWDSLEDYIEYCLSDIE